MTEPPASLDEETESGEEEMPDDDVERLHGAAVTVTNGQTVLHTDKAEYHDLIIIRNFYYLILKYLIIITAIF